MSSVISHVYMGNILKEKYNLGNEFLYGSILPDMLAKAEGPQTRELTHHLRHGILYGNEGDFPDVERFINDNNKILPNSQMMQGYLAHLIEDMLWFSVYIPKFILNYDEDTYILKKDSSFIKRDVFWNNMYSDYSILDGKLIKKLNIDFDELKEEFIKITDDANLKEAISNNFNKYEIKDKNLEIISEEDFEKYISNSLEKVSLVLDKIYN